MRALALLVVLLLAAQAARADESDAKRQARAHFRAGTTFFESGNYDQAIEEYEAAYRALPLPDFLFNLGQAHRLRGDLRLAIDFYQRYLEAKPNGEASQETREHIRELTVELERSTSAPPPASTTTPPPTTTITPPSATAVAASKPAPSEHRPLYKRWWLWTAVGAVAVVGIAVGVGVGVGRAGSTPTAATEFGTVRF